MIQDLDSKVIKVGDRVKLNFDVKEFNIYKHINLIQLYSFKNISLNLIQPDYSLMVPTNRLPHNKVPIILANYEEKLLKIEFENSKIIGYTKSFKINIKEAIVNKEILINHISEKEQIANEVYKPFVDKLLKTNSYFSSGLCTIQDREETILDYFFSFYNEAFKKEIVANKEKERIRKSNLSYEEYFAESWQRYVKIGNLKETINSIVFIWEKQIPNYRWEDDFFSEAQKRGIDKQTKLELFLSGYHISRKRYSNRTQEHLVISILENSTNGLIINVLFWEKNKGTSEFKIKNPWQNIQFNLMIEKIISGPIY